MAALTLVASEFEDPRERQREHRRIYNREYKLGLRRPKARRSVLIRLMARLHHEVWPGNEALGECWVWLGAQNSDGYGVIRGDAEPGQRQPLVLVHRVTLAAALGRPIAPGMEACHRCRGVRHCARPRHLYEGTRQENEDDKRADLGWERKPPRHGAEVAR